MVNVEVEISIDRKLEDVFKYVSDLTNDPEWHTDVISASRTSNGQIGPGNLYNWTLKYPGDDAPIEAEVEISEFEPNRSFSLLAVAGPLKQVMGYSFEENESGGTRLVRRLRLDHEQLPTEMEPEVTPHIIDRNEMYLANLKRHLETHRDTKPGPPKTLLPQIGGEGCMCGGH